MCSVLCVCVIFSTIFVDADGSTDDTFTHINNLGEVCSVTTIDDDDDNDDSNLEQARPANNVNECVSDDLKIKIK